MNTADNEHNECLATKLGAAYLSAETPSSLSLFSIVKACYKIYLNYGIPTFTLKAVNYAILSDSHRRELEKVSTHNHLNASEAVIVSPNSPRNGL